MRKVTVSRMRERYAQTALTFRIAYIHTYIHTYIHACIRTCIHNTYIHKYIHVYIYYILLISKVEGNHALGYASLLVTTPIYISS